MSSLPAIKHLIESRKEQWLEEYFTFLRFQSVSSEPAYKKELMACAAWLTDYLEGLGFKVEQWPTSGHPVLFASNLQAGKDKPTLLIYNHYDVQPVDPENLWDSPPFEPTLKGKEVYARGAQDNKGQCFYVIQALKFFLECNNGKFPLNIKLCIEGEEEMGSTGLSAIMQSKKEALKADYIAIVDLGMPKADTPALTLGTRGLVTMDVELKAADTDMHSGSHGGLALNPIHALARLLAGLHDADGKVVIPGFYDHIVEMSAEDKKRLSVEFDPEEYRKTVGAHPSGGEKGIPPLERAWLRPTLEINGINGGYSGPGFKTVIPALAHAKISCRLVPDQDPVRIGNLVVDYLKKKAPLGVSLTVDIHAGMGRAMRTDPSAHPIKVFAQAFSEVFNTPCQYTSAGGSIPIVGELADAAGGEVVMLGLGLAGDKIHAPNEHFGVDRIEKGIQVMARALELLGK